MRAEVIIPTVITVAYLVGVLVFWDRLERRERAYSPRRRTAEAALLEHPVYVPPGHPEYFPELDSLDGELAQVHDVLWPREEWLFVLDCPDPALTGYVTPAEAHAEEPGGVSYTCACGLVHVRRSRRARGRGMRGRGGRRRRPRADRSRSSP
ncbi:hypothetical protein [Nonomuraea sp. 10N515B]|uniref:hypothetical protein n=1 Tax=Nonomuraea sp. 10N515B TaxID=3457422 RepID=UPI003FCD67C3